MTKLLLLNRSAMLMHRGLWSNDSAVFSPGPFIESDGLGLGLGFGHYPRPLFQIGIFRIIIRTKIE